MMNFYLRINPRKSRRKYLVVMCSGIFSLILSLNAVHAQQDLTWSGAEDEDFWKEENWIPQAAPAGGDVLTIGTGDPHQPVFKGESRRDSDRFSRLNTEEGAELTIEGTLIPWGSDFLNGTINIKGNADFNVRSQVYVGREGSGTFNITGGAFNTRYNLYLGYGEGGEGTLNIWGGVVNVGQNLIIGENGGTGKISFKSVGRLNVPGDVATELEGWIDAGILVAEEEGDKLTVNFDAANNRTVVEIYQDPNSMLKETPTTVELDNGIVKVVIQKSNAHISSYQYEGREMANDIYYSMDGGSNYSQPANCVFTVKELNDDMVDISLKSHWEEGLRAQAFDIDIHYVLHKESSGLYTYAILSHPEDYPETGVGEWRMVWKLDQDQTEYICVDSLRHWEMPNAYDYENATQMGIPEIVRLNTGVRAGKYDCKYDFNAEYWNIGTYGHASEQNDVGSWLVFSGYEYFNDGPTKQDLTSAAGIIHVHFGMNHYNGSTTSVATGEEWSKIYGPFKLYLNSNKGGKDGLWEDALDLAEAEEDQWPYAWLTDTPEYPLTEERGSVSGSFAIEDHYKPEVTGAGAMIGLAQHEPGGNWQFESKNYQYWVEVAENGNFEIPHVRPGTYTLYAYSDGAVGEFEMANVTVTAGQTNNIGELTWEIPREKGDLVWEIGVPDRTAREFFHGNDYFQGYLWETFADDLPNPIDFTIGESDWSKDWNYAHSGYFKDGQSATWRWNVHFEIDEVPTEGEATLTIAFASANYSRMEVFVNNQYEFVERFYPSNTGGNALIREGIHAKYSVYELKFPASELKEGTNTITFVQGRSENASDHVMYDYISLETHLPEPSEEEEEEEPVDEEEEEENEEEPGEEEEKEEDPITNIENNREDTGLKLYPNPSSGRVRLDYRAGYTEGAKVSLINSNGKVLWEQQWSGSRASLDMDMSHLSAGVYYVQVISQRKVEAQKLIIRK